MIFSSDIIIALYTDKINYKMVTIRLQFGYKYLQNGYKLLQNCNNSACKKPPLGERGRDWRGSAPRPTKGLRPLESRKNDFFDRLNYYKIVIIDPRALRPGDLS